MNGDDVPRGGHMAGADRPQRLMGDRRLASGLQGGQACRQLIAADLQGLAYAASGPNLTLGP